MKKREERGVILIIGLMFGAVLFVAGTALISEVTQVSRGARHSTNQSEGLSLAEAGIEKAVYELNQNSSYTGETNVALGNGVLTISVATVDSSTKRITSTAYVPTAINPESVRTVKASVSIDPSVVSFMFGMQAGDGGIELKNSATIRGNAYATGPIVGENENLIQGDVVSAGASGLMDDIHATSSAYAHTIRNSRIDRNAYYQSIFNTTVNGTSFPGSTDQATSSLPISDEQIEEWKTTAAGGGTHTSPCPYTISSSLTLGPRKINCDLTISGNPTITLAGPVWVNGNIDISNSAIIKVSSSLGPTSVPVIADKPTAPTTSGTIELSNSVTAQGSGSANSYVLFISQNRSAEQGGDTTAIDLSNSASGALLLYAGHGEIALNNSISIKEVSGWKITAKNSSEVIYETGLANLNFSSGPGGSWAYVPGTYAIVQ